MAHEGVGSGGWWSKCTHDVPMTARGVLLQDLDVADPLHPRLTSNMLTATATKVEKMPEGSASGVSAIVEKQGPTLVEEVDAHPIATASTIQSPTDKEYNFHEDHDSKNETAHNSTEQHELEQNASSYHETARSSVERYKMEQNTCPE